ncbi:MAG: YcxB family protein [Phycisphaeraceae bacterium]
MAVEKSTIEFELTMDDWRAYNAYHYRHSPMVRRQYLWSLLLFPAIWLLLCCLIWFTASRENGDYLATFVALIPLFSGIPLYMVCFPMWYRYKLRSNIKQLLQEGENRGFLGPHKISIDKQAVTDADRSRTETVRWEAIEKIAKTDDYLFLYVNAIEAIIFPRRALPSQAGFDEFADQVASHVAIARRQAGWTSVRR